MANRVIFQIDEDEQREMDRKDLEIWYRDTNLHDTWDYNRLNYEISISTLKELADAFMEYEDADKYEILRDPADTDVADTFMSEIRYLLDELQWMLPAENLAKFKDSL